MFGLSVVAFGDGTTEKEVALTRLARRPIVLFLCALVLVGCGSKTRHTRLLCTLIGCGSGVRFSLSDVKKLWPGAGRVRFCVDGHCQSAPPRAGRLVTVNGPYLRSAAVVPISVEVLTDSGRVLYRGSANATVTKLAPNGVRCGPVCYSAVAAIDPQTRSLTTNQSEIRSNHLFP
jgi:hypothetical protein